MLKQIKKIAPFILSAFLVIVLGCASMDRFNSNDRSYYSTINEFTDRAEFYSGFINVFQMKGTILNSKVLNGQITKKSDAFNWSESQLAEEQTKIDNSLKTETKVFLSFFSPENKVNNLDSPSSIWRVFLDVNNKRYVGSVSTYVGFQNEARLFYPYHSVFAKAYLIKFPVPMMHVQDYPMKLTVTGTIGSDTIEFDPLKQ